MWEASLGGPERVAAGLEAAEHWGKGGTGVRWRQRRHRQVVCVGVGAGSLAARAVAALGRRRSPVPVVAAGSRRLPAFVGPDSLVVPLSWSGDDLETLLAADQAARAGASVVAVGGEGELSRRMVTGGHQHLPVADGSPVDRAGLPVLVVAALSVLRAASLLDPAEDLFPPALDQLRRRRDELAERGEPARSLARTVGRTFPLFHGGEGVGAVAARWWKAAVNLNAKAPAFASSQPGLSYEEVAGWGQHGDVTRQVLTAITLRCPGDPPDVSRRHDLVAPVLEEVVQEVLTVEARGGNDLAQLLDLILVGEVFSLLLAGNEDLDPGPVPMVDEMEADLRNSG